LYSVNELQFIIVVSQNDKQNC